MSTVIDPKERQKAQWGAAAAAWDRRFEWYSNAFRRLMDWCCDAAGLRAGSRLLDIACGSGQPAFSAAVRVGTTGHVTAVDLAPEMIAACRRRAEQRGIRNIEFRLMDAEALDVGEESFDAVTCSCGLMFFPDVDKALAGMRRALRPDGRVAFSVWDDPSKNPFITVAGGAVGQFFPPSPPNPNAPGGFRFAQPGVLEKVLEQSGFRDCAIESRPMTIEFESASEYWDVFTGMAAGIKEKIATLSASDTERLRQIVADAARPYANSGRLQLATAFLCASARK